MRRAKLIVGVAVAVVLVAGFGTMAYDVLVPDRQTWELPRVSEEDLANQMSESEGFHEVMGIVFDQADRKDVQVIGHGGDDITAQFIERYGRAYREHDWKALATGYLDEVDHVSWSGA